MVDINQLKAQEAARAAAKIQSYNNPNFNRPTPTVPPTLTPTTVGSPTRIQYDNLNKAGVKAGQLNYSYNPSSPTRGIEQDPRYRATSGVPKLLGVSAAEQRQKYGAEITSSNIAPAMRINYTRPTQPSTLTQQDINDMKKSGVMSTGATNVRYGGMSSVEEAIQNRQRIKDEKLQSALDRKMNEVQAPQTQDWKKSFNSNTETIQKKTYDTEGVGPNGFRKSFNSQNPGSVNTIPQNQTKQYTVIPNQQNNTISGSLSQNFTGSNPQPDNRPIPPYTFGVAPGASASLVSGAYLGMPLVDQIIGASNNLVNKFSEFTTPIIQKMVAPTPQEKTLPNLDNKQRTENLKVVEQLNRISSNSTPTPQPQPRPQDNFKAVFDGANEFASGFIDTAVDYQGLVNPNYKNKSTLNQSIDKAISGDFAGAGQLITQNPARFAGGLAFEIGTSLIPIGAATKAVKGMQVATKVVKTPAVRDAVKTGGSIIEKLWSNAEIERAVAKPAYKKVEAAAAKDIARRNKIVEENLSKARENGVDVSSLDKTDKKSVLSGKSAVKQTADNDAETMYGVREISNDYGRGLGRFADTFQGGPVNNLGNEFSGIRLERRVTDFVDDTGINIRNFLFDTLRGISEDVRGITRSEKVDRNVAYQAFREEQNSMYFPPKPQFDISKGLQSGTSLRNKTGRELSSQQIDALQASKRQIPVQPEKSTRVINDFAKNNRFVNMEYGAGKITKKETGFPWNPNPNLGKGKFPYLPAKTVAETRYLETIVGEHATKKYFGKKLIAPENAAKWAAIGTGVGAFGFMSQQVPKANAEKPKQNKTTPTYTMPIIKPAFNMITPSIQPVQSKNKITQKTTKPTPKQTTPKQTSTTYTSYQPVFDYNDVNALFDFDIRQPNEMNKKKKKKTGPPKSYLDMFDLGI